MTLLLNNAELQAETRLSVSVPLPGFKHLQVSPEQIPQLFQLVPALISMVGDAAERQRLAEE